MEAVKKLLFKISFQIFSRFDYMSCELVLALDIILAMLAFMTSLWLGDGIFEYKNAIVSTPRWLQLLVVLACQTICFLSFRTHKVILRFSTFLDALRILNSIAVNFLVLVIINVVVLSSGHDKLFINTALVIYVPVCFMLLFVLRVGAKVIYEQMQINMSPARKVLVFDVQESGLALAKMLRSDVSNNIRVAGFIDNSENPLNHELLGLKVYPLDKKLIPWMKDKGIGGIIVTQAKMKEIDPSKIITPFISAGISVLTNNSFTRWSSESQDDEETLRRGRINSIRIEDLLERPIINIDTDNVKQIIQGKVVMVSGAAGSIGSELVRQCLRYNPKAMVLFEMAESPLHDLTMDLRNQFPDQTIIPCIGDIRSRSRIEDVMRNYRPDVVYHAAAYKHVPLMEDHPNEAIRANVKGTKNMADLAVKYKVGRFVMISTDKAVNPSNVMGASKRIAEIYVQSLNREQNDTRFITTRFGNVLGSNGSVIPYFKKQIAQGGPVTVTHPDIIRYFMTIPEACTLVLEASTLGEGGEIFVFDMGQQVKILDLAKNMIRLAGYEPGRDIKIEFTGLRPGEKLYEELLNQKEITMPTNNPKIMRAKVREYDFKEASRQIDELIALSHECKFIPTVKKMKEIVPEFKSMNSTFEELDLDIKN